MDCICKIYKRWTVKSSMTFNYRYVASIFLKFGEVILCLQKTVWLSSALILLSFHKAFSIPVKNEKCEEKHESKFQNAFVCFFKNLQCNRA